MQSLEDVSPLDVLRSVRNLTLVQSGACAWRGGRAG